ncbi:MAG: hypothetical protein HeimC2_07110 [Candidatus Heimdallarchaeota archaeon LC_2]|nr:MAG: hypothetical protein HeimC2_07110 [Candidatus Heimdallarchaeota archaeon LC_2]
MSEKTKQEKFAPLASASGLMIIMIVFIIGAFVLTPLASEYWGDATKAERDAAPIGDPLQDDLEQLSSTPRWLEPFNFLGLALMMFGIALLFSTIPELLKTRGANMKAAFPKITGGNK